MDVVRKVENQPKDSDDKPRKKVVIADCGQMYNPNLPLLLGRAL